MCCLHYNAYIRRLIFDFFFAALDVFGFFFVCFSGPRWLFQHFGLSTPDLDPFKLVMSVLTTRENPPVH